MATSIRWSSTPRSSAAGHCWPPCASALSSSRVVTLVGPGGVGKTRVAVRIAEMERRSFRDGCWVVPLADVGNPELLITTVAETLGLQGTDRPWRVDTLADYIADRTALLVLDNCEHLLSAVGDLVEGLRAACPNLRFLLTSRRPLRLSGEHVVVVPPLGPARTRRVWPTPEAITHYEAVNLFARPRQVGSLGLRADPGQRSGRGHAVPRARRQSRWPSSSPRPGSGCCRRRRSATVSRERLTVLNRATATPRPAPVAARLRRVVLRPVHPSWSRGSGRGPRCSPAASTWQAATAVCAADDLPADEILDLVSALVDQSVSSPSEGRRRAHALPDAHRHPAVRPGAGREGRRAAGHAGAARHLVRRAGLPLRRRGLRAAPARLAAAAPAGAGEPADRHRVLRRDCRGCRGRPGDGTQARPVLVRLRTARRGTPLAGARAGHGRRDAAGASPRAWRWRPASRSCSTTGLRPGS